MDSEQKIEEKRKWNEPFLRAFNYLLDEGYAVTKGELCRKVGIEPGLISRYNNGTKKVSVATMNELARVSGGKLNVQYMLGKSQYMLLKNVPAEELIDIHNPDREVMGQKKTEQTQPTTSTIDPASQFNASISAYIQLTNRLSDDLKQKEHEMKERLAEKDARIVTLERTIADKESIIRDRDARILTLERQLALANNADLSRYPFTIGVSEREINNI